MDFITNYVKNSLTLIDQWKISKNDTTTKIKIITENKTSIEILEKNLGNNEFLINLKENITNKENDINKDIDTFTILENDIKNLNSECLSILKLLLDLYSKIKIETYEKCENEITNDPIGIEIAKLYCSDTDNLQLRGDPPISGIYKDKFSKGIYKDEFSKGF